VSQKNKENTWFEELNVLSGGLEALSWSLKKSFMEAKKADYSYFQILILIFQQKKCINPSEYGFNGTWIRIFDTPTVCSH
jgi:hypothetical protein